MGALALIRTVIDFHAVPERQADVHGRLLNWAAWSAGKAGAGAVSPMFRSYRSTDVWAVGAPSTPVDSLDALRIAKAVIALPDDHRAATNWYYIKPVAPARACRAIGVTMTGLAELVIAARAMLINRRA